MVMHLVKNNTKQDITMKKVLIILISIAALVSSCSKDNLWPDNTDPRIYIPRKGVSVNTAWLVDSKEYTVELGVYLSGVRPDNQTDNIDVVYKIDPTIITHYNNDITQTYAGVIVELPADCYEITGTKIAIPANEVSALIPIKIFTDKVLALGISLKQIKYAIPLALESSTKFDIIGDSAFKEAIYVVTIDQPRFYFWDNRNGQVTIARKLLYGQTPAVEKYRVTSYGLPSGEEYTLNFAVNAAAVPVGQQLLPAKAYELTSASVIIPANSTEAFFPMKLINDSITFRQTYYLPVSISSTSKYIPDATKGTLLLKIDVKNDYEWTYVSKISVRSYTSGRSGSYQLNKAPTSYDKETIQLQLITNNTVAGTAAGSTGTSSTYNNKFFRLKVIPNTADSRKWGVQLILITDMGTSNSPITLEFTPGLDSYYDWEYETFYLNYRWRHTDGKWIEASEILEAQF
jgi:hypothetical protein